MNPYNTANTYKQMEVNTSHRLKLVVMIYDAAIASIKQAQACHQRHDLIKRNQFISRTQFIINELNNSLDLQNGKEISTSLRKIYHFLNRHLNSILSDNDVKKLDDSLKILTNLRGAWEHITKKAGTENSGTVPAENNAAVYHQGKGLTY